jgi:hypothetical protein
MGRKAAATPPCEPGQRRLRSRFPRGLAPRRPRLYRESAVFSFVGVLGIAIVLFFVVAVTGRLILGR